MKNKTLFASLFCVLVIGVFLAACGGTPTPTIDSEGYKAEYYRGFYEACLYVPASVDIPGDTVDMHTEALCNEMVEAAKASFYYERRMTAGRLPAREQLLGTPLVTPTPTPAPETQG